MENEKSCTFLWLCIEVKQTHGVPSSLTTRPTCSEQMFEPHTLMELVCTNSNAALTSAVQAGNKDGNDGSMTRGKACTLAPSIDEDVERGTAVATSSGRAKLGCCSFERCLCSKQPEFSAGSCSSLDLHEPPLWPNVCTDSATVFGRFVALDSAPFTHGTAAAGTMFALVRILHGWQRLARLGKICGRCRRIKASFRSSGNGIRVHVGTIRDSRGFIRSRSRDRCIRFLTFG
jgi:hypothetical protein